MAITWEHEVSLIRNDILIVKAIEIVSVGVADSIVLDGLKDTTAGWDDSLVGKTVRNDKTKAETLIVSFVSSGELKLQDDIFTAIANYTIFSGNVYSESMHKSHAEAEFKSLLKAKIKSDRDKKSDESTQHSKFDFSNFETEINA